MKRIWFLIAAFAILAAFHASASAAVYTESFVIGESGSTKADSLNENGILIRNNRSTSDKTKRGSNLREAYIKIDISGYAGKYPVEQARLRLYLKTPPSNNGTTLSENETPTCDVYAFASFNTEWDSSTITYTDALSSGVRPEVNEMEENPVTYAENPALGYLDMQSFSSKSSTTTAYYFDITPFVNDLLRRGQNVGTLTLMQAGGSISRESTVMQFYCEDTASSDTALIPAIVITPGIEAVVTDRTVKDYSAEKTPYATVSVHNNTSAETPVELLGVISDADGRIYDTSYLSEIVPANGRNSSSLTLEFSKTLPENIEGFTLRIYAFDDIDKMSLLNRSYTYGDSGEALIVRESEPALKDEPSVAEINITANNSNDGIIRISGALDAKKEGTPIVASAYLSDTEQTDKGQALAQSVTDKNGEFEATLYMPACSGTYEIVVGGLNIDGSGILENVMFFTKADTAAVLDMINAAQNEAEMEAALQGVSESGSRKLDILGVDYAPALSILNSTADLGGFYTYLLSKKTESGAFEDSAAFIEALKETADMYTIMRASECNNQLREAVEGYVCETDIYITLYSGNNPELDDGLKNDIITSLLGRSYSKVGELCSAFEENTVLLSLSGVLYTDVEQVLRLGAEVLGFNIDEESAYNDLQQSQKANVLKSFGSADFGSSEEVYDKLCSWISSQKQSVSSNTIIRTSGGGGGGASVPVVKITPEEAAAAVPTPLDSSNIAEFKDLEGYEWAQEAINSLFKKGIIAAGDGYFRPGDDVTRAEFVKMLVCAFDVLDEDAECSFSDTDKDKWHYVYIASAYNRGIVSGISEMQFGAERNITRQEMAAMAYRGLKLMNIEPSIADCSFTDSNSISDWAVTPVYALKNAGIINGVSVNEFAPLKNAVRAEASVIINGLLSYIDNKGEEQ